jgi:hypothetical protein
MQQRFSHLQPHLFHRLHLSLEIPHPLVHLTPPASASELYLCTGKTSEVSNLLVHLTANLLMLAHLLLH